MLGLALIPDLERAALPPAALTDRDALGIVAAGAERRGAVGADPFVAALVALLLLLEALLQLLHDLFPAAHRLDLLHLLLGEKALGLLAQPLLGNLGAEELVGDLLHALEIGADHAGAGVRSLRVFNRVEQRPVG